MGRVAVAFEIIFLFCLDLYSNVCALYFMLISFFYILEFSLSISRGLRYDGGLDEHTRKRLQAEAQRLEKISLQHVQDLMRRVEEVIGLWRLLGDHQFHVLAAAMSQV